MEQKGFVLWLTGLPCSGKTTVADIAANKLKDSGYKIERLDGDIVRKSLSRDLGFTKEDRDKNIERVIFVSKLLARNGVGVIVSFVSPYRSKRSEARGEIEEFLEVHVKCPLAVCEKRDVKGMYKKARAGEIEKFTGVTDPYEEPINPEIVIDTDNTTPEQCSDVIIEALKEKGYLSKTQEAVL